MVSSSHPRLFGGKRGTKKKRSGKNNGKLKRKKIIPMRKPKKNALFVDKTIISRGIAKIT